mmetsp:Transcript_24905/g.48990  ORF Transcript_24905/g.48990 Transcript_24905/m.48990 type:complete len:164 (-) Transcript_24905:214-705(-)
MLSVCCVINEWVTQNVDAGMAESIIHAVKKWLMLQHDVDHSHTSLTLADLIQSSYYKELQTERDEEKAAMKEWMYQKMLMTPSTKEHKDWEFRVLIANQVTTMATKADLQKQNRELMQKPQEMQQAMDAILHEKAKTQAYQVVPPDPLPTQFRAVPATGETVN